MKVLCLFNPSNTPTCHLVWNLGHFNFVPVLSAVLLSQLPWPPESGSTIKVNMSCNICLNKQLMKAFFSGEDSLTKSQYEWLTTPYKQFNDGNPRSVSNILSPLSMYKGGVLVHCSNRKTNLAPNCSVLLCLLASEI